MKFFCIGDSYPFPAHPGLDRHEVKRGQPFYHNAYAGPFCRYHAQVYQQRMIKHYEETVKEKTTT